MSRSGEPVELTRVDIRSVWPGEARDFTPWLSEHLELLGEHLGLGELSLEATEVPIPGGRNLDVLAVDTDGAKWAIENQYGVGDHDHLTRGLAYAVALECRALVVVAEDHRDEFVAVADEWNRYSEAYGRDGILLFLAVVEAWRIGDSAPGFRFRLHTGPNEWKVAARSSAAQSAAQAERSLANRDFWAAFLPVINEKSPLFRAIAPRSGPYPDVRSGPFHHQVWVRAEDCTIQLRIDSGVADDNDALFEEIESRRLEVEERFGAPLQWNRSDNHRACFVKYQEEGTAGWKTTPEERAPGIDRVVDTFIRFHESLEPVLATLA